MERFDFEEHSHRRFNPFTGEYVQVSPHRGKRPWQGQQEKAPEEEGLHYDSTCYLCPGNPRVGGDLNPSYETTFAFTNDFGAINEEVPDGEMSEGEFFQARSEKGICKVVCFSPRHDLTIPELALEDVEKVVHLWKKEYQELGSLSYINNVQVFENKGQIMGCSNPHPHGQIWAQQSIPTEQVKKSLRFTEYYHRKGRSMVVNYVQEELKKKDRVLFENNTFVGLVPFWAVWPFEAMIAPKVHLPSLSEMDNAQLKDLADAYRKLTILYDNLFEVSFPYSGGIHQAPTDGHKHPEWDLHIVFYPPLLRSSTVKKFMVGYEMLANPQRDLTPEKAAGLLKTLPQQHYKVKTN
ncbi:UDP-glucose--hexose-1-phosphate uridylyltransferase [Litoribacter alkaliphilus]|uniref:Galactose-1-phosphate uridylyltransferase n=1 Tax=Litoribacter ruber TaxID=702568 RepID=A0AAP2CJ83_9BACT|nr:UDP-glucose--hexose-1-phosphate uridylyltransferase [Litoribacter alkaliphilus]MBS9525736.1 UDP-glucose--hexose-1-phosphate uridylyltransferase [Litoribacter alkaliphilus]